MKQINVKLSDTAHATLKRLSASSGVPLARTIELALATLDGATVKTEEIGFDGRGVPVTQTISGSEGRSSSSPTNPSEPAELIDGEDDLSDVLTPEPIPAPEPPTDRDRWIEAHTVEQPVRVRDTERAPSRLTAEDELGIDDLLAAYADL